MVKHNMTFKILDLYCKAGGAGMGLYRGFIERYPNLLIVGLDISFQPNYPAFHNAPYANNFTFIQGDALSPSFNLKDFDFIWASPMCQDYTTLKFINGRTYPRQILATRALLKESGKPYIIENVKGARYELDNPLMLCGTMFGLRVQRHRYFECSPPILFSPYSCNHWGRTYGQNASTKIRRGAQSFALAPFITVAGHDYKLADGKKAMGIDWMNTSELSESIPPAYSEYLARQISLTSETDL